MKKTSKNTPAPVAAVVEETVPTIPSRAVPAEVSPLADALPSSRQLLRSTAIAAAVAGVLLLVAVLPAEYGVDPTGIGRLLGLTPMGEIKASLEKEVAVGRGAAPVSMAPLPVPSATAQAAATGALKHEVRITLTPNEGRELKLVMRKGARASYIWSADGGLTVDAHGEATNGRADSYHSYGKATGKRFDEGTLVAEFDGSHGWFWRNRNHNDVTVTLRVQGEYQDILQSGPIAPSKPLDPKPGDHDHGEGHAH